MKTTLILLEGERLTIEPCTFTPGVRIEHSYISDGTIAQMHIPADLCGVFAQAVELAADTLEPVPNAEDLAALALKGGLTVEQAHLGKPFWEFMNAAKHAAECFANYEQVTREVCTLDSAAQVPKDFNRVFDESANPEEWLRFRRCAQVSAEASAAAAAAWTRYRAAVTA